MLLFCSDRLKFERKRLKFTQQVLAESLGVVDMTIKRWESGTTPIPSDKLIALQGLGFNVPFILFGDEAMPALTSEENLILSRYRQANLEIKNKILMTLIGGDITNASPPVASVQTHTGSGDQFNDTSRQINKGQKQTNNFHGDFGGDYVNGNKKG